MKRRAFQIVVLIILGAIVNVAVAWACVLTRSPDLSNTAMEKTGGRFWGPEFHYFGWNIVERTAVGSQVIISTWNGPAGGGIGGSDPPNKPETLIPIWAPELSPHKHAAIQDSRWLVVAREDGWPFTSLRGVDGYAEYEEFVEQDLEKVEYPFVWKRLDKAHQALRIFCSPSPNTDPSQLRFVPIGLIWPAFAINTIFYAAVLWGVFFGPWMVRRRIRRRRGLCPACAYPIGTSPVCTECGKALA